MGSVPNVPKVSRLLVTRKPAPFLDVPDVPVKKHMNAIDCAGSPATLSRRWLIHFTDRESVAVYFASDVDQAQALAGYPDAVAAEPYAPAVRAPDAPMTAGEEAAIRAWLACIGETDPANIADVLSLCQRDADARNYCVARGQGMP
jgi:hypothetical protein